MTCPARTRPPSEAGAAGPLRPRREIAISTATVARCSKADMLRRHRQAHGLGMELEDRRQLGPPDLGATTRHPPGEVGAPSRGLLRRKAHAKKSTVAYICDGTRSWGARFLRRTASPDDATVAEMAALRPKKYWRFARARARARRAGLCHASQDRDAPCDRQATAGPERGHCGRGPASPLD